MFRFILFLLTFTTLSVTAPNPELIIGEEHIPPGIVMIFEGAVKDRVVPAAQHLAMEKTDVHIEARVNWADVGPVPEGTPRGGFVAYLHLHAEVKNQRTGAVAFVTLLPHINLIDNFHYARNMALPGALGDLYTVTFHVAPPEASGLALHHDWHTTHGDQLFTAISFTYPDVNFEEIAKATRGS